MAKEFSTCVHCKTKIVFAKGRGSKPSGPAWRHVASGARVCPGTFRATPVIEAKVNGDMIDPMTEWTPEQKEQWAVRYLAGAATIKAHSEAKASSADG